MAARRRRRRRVTKKQQVVIDRQRVSRALIGLGGLYFFAMGFAQESPLMQIFSTYASFVMGEVGVTLFFALLLFAGLLIWLRGQQMRFVIKMILFLLVLLSALLNFPALESASQDFHGFGGYISYPLLYVLDQLFGGSVMATKSFVILLLLLYFAYLWYVFRIPVPSFSVSVKDGGVVGRPRPAPTYSSRQKTDKGGQSRRQGNLLKDVVRDATSKVAGSERRQEKRILQGLVKDTIKKKQDRLVEKKQLAKITFPADKPTFSPDLLVQGDGGEQYLDNSFLVHKAKELQAKLMEFNVPVTIDGFDIGPSIVQIRIRPEAGIKVSAIENLKSDITMSLRAKALRIVAPIPGTDCVGIQLPNPQPQVVRLGDILKSADFLRTMKKGFTNLALGKALDGTTVVKRLDKMPHLLVAGATGSGKSVGVNDFVLSLMYQNSPAELKFLMVDPKQVEMELYSGLPYLLAPIITEPDKALRMLKWAVEEMEVRYRLLKQHRVKHLDEYNAKTTGDKLYRIVIVIDELADLMMSGNKKDTELCITRIAQKARAVGMHLLVATQRPSVNVITGLIKANMPTRISFAVVSQIDSRTILGMKGGEELVGRGDLLYKDAETKYPMRIQAPFVDTDEIERVVHAIKEKYMKGLQESDIYHPDVLSALDGRKSFNLDIGGMNSGSTGSDDDLVLRAKDLILQTRKASATMLQRKLNIGFARAARVLDELEQQGVVGPQVGSRPREVLL